jgi:hypothetical protein
MIWIVNAEITGTLTVKTEFNDGLSGIIDFRNIFQNDHRFVVRELLDINKFNSCKPEFDLSKHSNSIQINDFQI